MDWALPNMLRIDDGSTVSVAWPRNGQDDILPHVSIAQLCVASPGVQQNCHNFSFLLVPLLYTYPDQ